VLRAPTVTGRESMVPAEVSQERYESVRDGANRFLGLDRNQSGHVEGGAMLGACIVALAASLLFVGCPDWQRPACPAPGAYSCVNGQPHYCARTTRELTPIGDEPCSAQGRACAFNDAGQTFCARLDAAVSE
jgi:hypothetical protein